LELTGLEGLFTFRKGKPTERFRTKQTKEKRKVRQEKKKTKMCLARANYIKVGLTKEKPWKKEIMSRGDKGPFQGQIW